MNTTIEDKTFDPVLLRNFYKYIERGIITPINYSSIAERLNLSDVSRYQAYLNPSARSYRKPSNSMCRLAYYVAQELLAEGWQI